jgi:hypothetical protein
MIDGTPLFRPLAARRAAQLAAMDAAATQEALLLGLLREAAATRFGTAHGFAQMRSVADFQARVPLRRYEDFRRDWWSDWPILDNATWPGRIPYFALSSGTSAGTTKRIPVTRAMMRANRAAAFDVLARHLARHPRATPFGGLSFMLGGSTALEQPAPGVRAGDLSAIAAVEVPWFLRPWCFPRAADALIPDWSAKLERLAQTTPVTRITTLTGTPSWVLVLLEKLAERHGAPPLPALQLLIHGGVAWPPYRARFAPLLPRGCATHEVYPASEAFCAMADRGDGEGLALCLDQGCFFEFVPRAEIDAPMPTRHWAATIETGVDYAVIVTSCAGLWAYILGDTVRFLDRTPPRLLITGRLSYDLSVFGEHLSGEELDRSVLAACEAAGVTLAEYIAGATLDGPRGRHVFLIEPAATGHDAAPLAPALDAAWLASVLDAALRAENDDYAAHRDGGQLDAPEVLLLAPGAIARWMASRGKAGGQNKVPRVIADPDAFTAARAALR